MTEAAKTLLDLEAMSGETLDGIEEAPDFITPPPGEYLLLVTDAKIDKYETKDGLPAQRLKVMYSVAKTINTVNDEPPVADGSIFSETFQGTEQGLSFFKKRIRELMNAENVQGVTLADMMSSVKGQQVKARLSIKKTAKKGVPGEFYENLQIRILSEE